MGHLKSVKHFLINVLKGPDEIGPCVLKEPAPAIAPILTAYINRETPDDFKNAKVVPIYKKGMKSDPTNYRRISLTCISCKLMEHIVTSSNMHQARENDILYDLQHGFLDRRSSETQLI